MSQTKYKMLPRIGLGLFACLLSLGLRAAPQPVAEYRVIGFTATPTNGEIRAVGEFGNRLLGYAAMDRQCQVDVDPNSRVATVTEWQTTHLAPLPRGFTGAWLDPGPANLVYVHDAPVDGDDWIAVTAGPRIKRTQHGATLDEALGSLDCFGHQSGAASNFGLVGARPGYILNLTCEARYHIACAALVEVPVISP